MEYYELNIQMSPCSEELQERMSGLLHLHEPEGLLETDDGWTAYFSGRKNDKDLIINDIRERWDKGKLEFSWNGIPWKNWNSEWEKNFKQVRIAGKCMVRAPFHEKEEGFTYDIVISPKMSFGTGHHATTALMMELLLETDIRGSRLLDMGAGTGILSILGSMLGAKEITSIDNDPIAYENCKENLQANGVSNAEVIEGGEEIIPSLTYDIILANINRNILLEQMDTYSNRLARKGKLILSGFLKGDDEIIEKKAGELGLRTIKKLERSDWTAMVFAF